MQLINRLGKLICFQAACLSLNINWELMKIPFTDAIGSLSSWSSSYSSLSLVAGGAPPCKANSFSSFLYIEVRWQSQDSKNSWNEVPNYPSGHSPYALIPVPRKVTVAMQWRRGIWIELLRCADSVHLMSRMMANHFVIVWWLRIRMEC